MVTSGAYFDVTGSQSGGNYADSKHVGKSLLYHDQELYITSVQSATSVTANVIDELFVQLDANAFRTVDGSTTVEVTHIKHGMVASDAFTIRNATAVGGITASNLNGSETVAKVLDEDRYTFVAGGTANASTDGGGIVQIVTHAPTTDWYDFDLGTAADDDSIHLVASIGEIATIRHFVSNRDIHIFTSGSEFYIPVFQNEPITPTNARIKRQTSFGSTYIRPQPFYGATIFAQIGGKMVRQFIYDDSEGAYKADPIHCFLRT